MSSQPDNLTPAQLEQRANAAVSHGAGAYSKKVDAGMPLTHAMALVESQVVALYEQGGDRGMIAAAALKLGTMAQLVHDHINRAAPADSERLIELWRKLLKDAVNTHYKHATLPSDDQLAITAARVLEVTPDADTE